MKTKPVVLMITEKNIDFSISRRNILESGFTESVNVCNNFARAFELIWELNFKHADCPILVFVDIKKVHETEFAFVEEFERIPRSLRSRIKVVLLVDEIKVFLDARFRSCKSVMGSFIKPLIKANIEELNLLLEEDAARKMRLVSV